MLSRHKLILSFSLQIFISLNVFAQKPKLYVQKGHVGPIYTLAYSPDGRILASAGADKTVRLWDVATRREIRNLVGHDSMVTSLAISRDGKLLASGGMDGQVKVWDIATGQLVWLYGHSTPIMGTAFSPDGRFLAAWSSDLILWDVKNWQEAKRFKTDANVIKLANMFGSPSTSVPFAFSPDSTKIYALSDGRLKSFDVATGKKLKTFELILFSCIAISPDGATVAIGHRDFEVISREPFKTRHFGAIEIFDAAKGKLIKKLEAHPGNESQGKLNALSFSPDGRVLASAGEDRTTKLWDTSSWREIKTLTGHKDDINALAFSPDGNLLATATGSSSVTGRESNIQLWNPQTGLQVATLAGQSSRATGMAVSTDGKKLAYLETDTRRTILSIWDLAKGQKARTFEIPLWLFSVTFSPDGRSLLTAGRDGTARLWDAESGRVRQIIYAHADTAFYASFSPEGRRIVTASADKTIKMWDVGSGRELKTFYGHRDNVMCVVFGPNGKILASTGNDKTVRLWDVDSGHQIKSLIDPVSELKIAKIPRQSELFEQMTSGEMFGGGVVTFSPDGRTLAVSFGGYVMARVANKEEVAKLTNEIRLYDVEDGVKVRQLEGHQETVHSLSFSTDGQSLASGSADKTIAVWDVNTGRRTVSRSDNLDFDAYATFIPNKNLVAGGSRNLLHLWDSTSVELLATMTSVENTNEWLVVTPEGLFDGSPTAWQFLLWRFSQNTFDVLPVEAYFSDFFQPNLLTDIYSGERPKTLAHIENKDRRQPSLKISLPEINTGSVASRVIKVKIEVAEVPPDETHGDGSGVRDVRLFRNGSLVKAWRGEVTLSGQGKADFEVSVPIIAGENVLTAYAFNRDNVKSLDTTAKIIGAETLRRQGTAYILTIGVNSYANPQYNLKYAVPDARDFGEELQRQQYNLARFANVEVISLLDKNATKANILLALKRLAGSDTMLPAGVPDGLGRIKPVQPEDTVVIYFSGHGTAQQNQFYLIPYDLGYLGPRTKLDRNALQQILTHSISDRELQLAFEQIDVGQMLLVIDACNSGQALEADEKRRGPMNSRGLAQLAYEKGMYILTAAQSYQVALETSRLGHGYLTYALIEEGLKTARADVEPRNGQVTVREWIDFVTERVPQMQQQLPQTSPVPEAQVQPQSTLPQNPRRRRRVPQKITKSQRELVQEDATTTTQISPEDRLIQRPRVFYRREAEPQPFIVAQP